MNSEAKNLEVIARAIKAHDDSCDSPAIAVLMNPFEVERLDWDEIAGVPIQSDSKIQTGRFKIICDKISSPPNVFPE